MFADEEKRAEIYRKLVENKGPATRIALVGASADPQKYGNIILRNLGEKGFTILPVNPRGGEIDGLDVYSSLADVPGEVDIINVVTPPAVSRKVLAQAERLGHKVIWFQEGSFDAEVLADLGGLAIQGIFDACIMVVASWTELPE